MPPVEKCFFCHKYVIPDHPEILKEKAYLDAKKPVPWVRVFWTPEFVFFRHEPHIRGPASTAPNAMERWGAWTDCPGWIFRWGFASTCHRKMDAQLDCWLGCHR